MLGDLAVFHSPKIIVGGRRAAEGSFADGKNKVALCQHLMRCGVDHLNILLGKSRKCSTESGKAIGNAGIVLKVAVAVKIIRCLFGTLTLHNIVEEVLDKLTVSLCFVRVLYFLCAVDLRSSRRIGICFCRKVIPVLCNLSVFVKAEDVKGNLLSCACEVVNRLKENLVAVFKSADIVYRGFYRSRRKVSHRADKCVFSCAVSKVMLDVSFGKQACCFFGVSGCECVNQFKCFLSVCHFDYLFHIILALAEQFFENAHFGALLMFCFELRSGRSP